MPSLIKNGRTSVALMQSSADNVIVDFGVISGSGVLNKVFMRASNNGTGTNALSDFIARIEIFIDGEITASTIFKLANGDNPAGANDFKEMFTDKGVLPQTIGDWHYIVYSPNTNNASNMTVMLGVKIAFSTSIQVKLISVMKNTAASAGNSVCSGAIEVSVV